MKTTLNRWMWPGCLLVLLAGINSAQAFYNPTTGRWLSRDPLGEVGGMNLYELAGNGALNAVDSVGLKSLTIVVARDQTLKGDYNAGKVRELNQVQKSTLESVLGLCKEKRCGGHTEIPKVIVVYKQNMVLPAPADVKWDIDDETGDVKLLQSNWNALTKAGEGVPVFWTLDFLYRSKPVSGTPSGVGGNGKGILLSYSGALFSSKILAHEIGHYAGYSGGDIEDNVHSSDPANVMSKMDGTQPDSDWCEKVLLLAK